MKLCKDCAHCDEVHGFYTCLRLGKLPPSPVDGHEVRIKLNAFEERAPLTWLERWRHHWYGGTERCGPDGRYWMQR